MLWRAINFVLVLLSYSHDCEVSDFIRGHDCRLSKVPYPDINNASFDRHSKRELFNEDPIVDRAILSEYRHARSVKLRRVKIRNRLVPNLFEVAPKAKCNLLLVRYCDRSAWVRIDRKAALWRGNFAEVCDRIACKKLACIDRGIRDMEVGSAVPSSFRLSFLEVIWSDSILASPVSALSLDEGGFFWGGFRNNLDRPDFEEISEEGFRSIALQMNMKSTSAVKWQEPIDWPDWIQVPFCDLLRGDKESTNKCVRPVQCWQSIRHLTFWEFMNFERRYRRSGEKTRLADRSTVAGLNSMYFRLWP
jgi:hypothetical protein